MHEVNNIYFNVGAPFSAKKYLGISTSRSISTMKPLADQVDALEEKELVESISHEIVYRHKEFAFINTYNMIAVCIMMSLHESKPITINQLVKNVIKLTKTVRDFKGNVFDHDENNAESRIDEALKVHNTSVIKDIEGNIKLIRTNDETLDITKKFKGVNEYPNIYLVLFIILIYFQGMRSIKKQFLLVLLSLFFNCMLMELFLYYFLHL